MPLNQAELGSNIYSQIISAISGAYPDSTPQPSMKIFADAVASGVVTYYTGAQGKITTTGSLGGTTTGLTGLNPASMADTIEGLCKIAFGTQGGVTLKMICTAIATAVCQEFANATIVGTDAGVAKGFDNGSTQTMADTMWQFTGWPETAVNRKFFKAISDGIHIEIIDKGQAIIPPSSPGAAAGIATIS